MRRVISIVVILLGAQSMTGWPASVAAWGKPSNCPASQPPLAPSGPHDTGALAQRAGGGQPEVRLMRYPRPDTPGNWSQWGQGLVLAGGRFVSAIGDELGADGNSFVYVYDPATNQITRTDDVLSHVEHK